MKNELDIAKKLLDKDAIKEKYQSLLDNSKYSSQQRGFEFENLIYSLLHNAKLEPRAGYRPTGEQVDGSFFWQGQTFLLEAKWVKDPLPVSSIYAFKGKLDGKFHTTSGIYISVNGYSPDVEDALKFGKSLNILLFDENDVPLLFNGEVEFLDMLKFKLREAGDTGSLIVPYNLKEKAEKIALDPKEMLNFQNFIEKVGVNAIPEQRPILTDLLIFVEGQTDVKLATKILERIKSKYFFSYHVFPLDGVKNIRKLPALLNVYGSYGKTKAVIVLLDQDAETNLLIPVIENVKEQIRSSSIPLKTCILYLSDDLKVQLSSRRSNQSIIESLPVFETLEAFIQDIADDYYDPVTDTPMEVLKSRLEALSWNFEEQEIEGEDDYSSHSFSIKSIDELINYLNDEMVNAMYGEMPMEWLKEQESLDYETEIREYLIDHYSDKISQLGWDVREL